MNEHRKLVLTAQVLAKMVREEWGGPLSDVVFIYGPHRLTEDQEEAVKWFEETYIKEDD